MSTDTYSKWATISDALWFPNDLPSTTLYLSPLFWTYCRLYPTFPLILLGSFSGLMDLKFFSFFFSLFIFFLLFYWSTSSSSFPILLAWEASFLKLYPSKYICFKMWLTAWKYKPFDSKLSLLVFLNALLPLHLEKANAIMSPSPFVWDLFIPLCGSFQNLFFFVADVPWYWALLRFLNWMIFMPSQLQESFLVMFL